MNYHALNSCKKISNFLCNICEDRQWAERNTIPLPKNIKMLKELASIGHYKAKNKVKELLTIRGNLFRLSK